MLPAALLLFLAGAALGVCASALELVPLDNGTPDENLMIANWESGSFIDRAPGIPALRSPVFTFPYNQQDSQIWGYTFNSTLNGTTLFTLSGLFPADKIFIGVKANKLVAQTQPTLFTLNPLPFDPTASTLGLPGSDLAVTASRVHGSQLSLKAMDMTNPLQHWRFFVPSN